MSIKEIVSNIGGYALGIVIMLFLTAIPVFFIVGVMWISEKILPWLILISIFALAFNLLILLPLAMIRSTRPWAGFGFVISSYIFGITGWFMGFILTWTLWGLIAVIIGLLILGVGVVPIAILATFLNGMWIEFGILVLAVILTFGLRMFGTELAGSA